MIDDMNQDLSEIFAQANGLMKDWDFTDGAMKLRVKFVNKSNNPDPTYAKEGDSGFDLRAFMPEDSFMVVKPGKRALIFTGLHFQIPLNFELQIRPRSGMAAKNGITVLNSPGTIDSGYRGEIIVILYNTDENEFIVRNGDRIAQGVIAPVNTLDNTMFIKSETLDESERGEGRFGHSGTK